MTDKEVMQMALDVLTNKRYAPSIKETTEALRAALAQPEPEPVAWRIRSTDPLRDWTLMYCYPRTEEKFSNMEIQPLYTKPHSAAHSADSAESFCKPEPVAWMYINKMGGRQVSLMEPPQELKKDYYALYMAQPNPQLAQRNGNCLLTGVCAAEGHRITKEKLNQKPVVWMYQDKSTNEVRFQKHMRAFVDHGATDEMPLFTAPPQREWVGLTDEEIKLFWSRSLADTEGETYLPLPEFARAIEAKLKEKNGG